MRGRKRHKNIFFYWCQIHLITTRVIYVMNIYNGSAKKWRLYFFVNFSFRQCVINHAATKKTWRPRLYLTTLTIRIVSRLAYSKLVPTLEAPLRNNSISILTDHLILTSAAFVNSGIVDAAGVTCVISAAPELPLVPLSENVTFHRVDILDCFDSNISKFFDDVSDLIEKVNFYIAFVQFSSRHVQLFRKMKILI